MHVASRVALCLPLLADLLLVDGDPITNIGLVADPALDQV
jgi:hypothetical protein